MTESDTTVLNTAPTDADQTVSAPGSQADDARRALTAVRDRAS